MTTALAIGAERAFGAEIVAALEAEGFAVARDIADVAGPLDLLVVNAPVVPRRIAFRDMTDADFAEPIEALLYEFVASVQAAAPRMTGGGAIVQVASRAHLGTWDGVDIAAAAGASIAMARSMALELGPRGIRVNTLAADVPGEKWDTPPARRDLAGTVAWLGSPASRLISGQLILLDAARALRMGFAAKR